MDVQRALVLVIAGVLSGCATSTYYYQAPQMSPAFYEVGEVVGVELVAPVPPAGFCYYGGCPPSDKVRVRDAISLRGPDGIIQLGDSGVLNDAAISPAHAQTPGWTIHNIIRMNDEAEITIVDSADKGLAIGQFVRIGFDRTSIGQRQLPNAYLVAPDEEVLNLVAENEKVISSWAPPGPEGRIIPQLESELAMYRPSYIPVPRDLLFRELDGMVEQELIVLRFSGLRLLSAIEEEYVDFTLGLQSEEGLRESIEVIYFETNLGWGIREAWEEFEAGALPGFSSWFESNYVGR